MRKIGRILILVLFIALYFLDYFLSFDSSWSNPVFIDPTPNRDNFSTDHACLGRGQSDESTLSTNEVNVYWNGHNKTIDAPAGEACYLGIQGMRI